MHINVDITTSRYLHLVEEAGLGRVEVIELERPVSSFPTYEVSPFRPIPQ